MGLHTLLKLVDFFMKGKDLSAPTRKNRTFFFIDNNRWWIMSRNILFVLLYNRHKILNHMDESIRVERWGRRVKQVSLLPGFVCTGTHPEILRVTSPTPASPRIVLSSAAIWRHLLRQVHHTVPPQRLYIQLDTELYLPFTWASRCCRLAGRPTFSYSSTDLCCNHLNTSALFVPARLLLFQRSILPYICPDPTGGSNTYW
jgi:hypothetical protein